jgi:hypothetical protein
VSKITIIDHEFFSLWYYTDKKIVHHKFNKAFYGPEFRASLEKGTEILKLHGARKWLSDDRLFTELPQDDLDWGVNSWGPRTVVAGWRYWAIVLPESFLNQMSHSVIEANFSRIGVMAKVFTTPEEGMAWLEAQ